MADYYPLIARAVAGLENSTGEARRALYERARSALIAQLRGVEPALSESDITRERLALEEAVRKVEAEAAQRKRIQPPRPDPAAKVRPGDALRSSSGQPSQPSAKPQGDRSVPEERSAAGKAGEKRAAAPTDAGPRTPRPDMTSARERAGLPPRKPSLTEQSTRGLRDVVAEADELGRAATQANRSARRSYAAVPSPSPEFDRLEPSLEQRGAGDAPYYNESSGEPVRPQPSRPRAPRPEPVRRGPKRSNNGLYKILIVVGVLLVIGGVAIWRLPQIVTSVAGLFTPTPVMQTQKDGAPAARPKIPDRVGQPSQVAAVAQRVVLYDEDPNEQQGKQYTGTVVWRVETVPGGPGQAPDLAVRADVDIPDRKLKMSLSIRRNSDQSLPASHTAELSYILGPDFDGGVVANVPGILMKQTEQTRGTPLAGLAVKVTDGFFLIGLSNVETDRQRNIQLLKDRAWFDVPMVYGNQRRAILAIEKGAPGERAFAEAFAAWGQ